MKNFSPYTDLALEVAESLTNNTDNDLEGLKIFTEDCEMKKTSVTSVDRGGKNGQTHGHLYNIGKCFYKRK
jgi:hypothetical protein